MHGSIFACMVLAFKWAVRAYVCVNAIYGNKPMLFVYFERLRVAVLVSSCYALSMCRVRPSRA